MPRFRKLAIDDVREKKSAHDLVTEGDLAAEKAITDALRARYPDALIVGEEAAEANPDLIEGLRDADFGFVIDPIDGTFNFVSDVPVFGTILAVVAKGECIAGIIHYPTSGESMIASVGAGSRLLENDGRTRPIRVADPVPLEDMVGTISWGFMAEPMRSRVAVNLARIAVSFAMRCSAWEYRLAASGKVHFIGANRLLPWDHLAGDLIHREAGGYSARFDGSSYRPGMTAGGLISAPNRQSWQEIRTRIIGD
jgi:myo-inositol-1(or 4)-monophosphatase